MTWALFRVELNPKMNTNCWLEKEQKYLLPIDLCEVVLDVNA